MTERRPYWSSRISSRSRRLAASIGAIPALPRRNRWRVAPDHGVDVRYPGRGEGCGEPPRLRRHLLPSQVPGGRNSRSRAREVLLQQRDGARMRSSFAGGQSVRIRHRFSGRLDRVGGGREFRLSGIVAQRADLVLSGVERRRPGAERRTRSTAAAAPPCRRAQPSSLRSGQAGGQRPVAAASSEQPDEAQLPGGTVVAVELGVGGPLLLHRGGLRAEPGHGDRPVVDV